MLIGSIYWRQIILLINSNDSIPPFHILCRARVSKLKTTNGQLIRYVSDAGHIL